VPSQNGADPVCLQPHRNISELLCSASNRTGLILVTLWRPSQNGWGKQNKKTVLKEWEKKKKKTITFFFRVISPDITRTESDYFNYHYLFTHFQFII